MKKTSLSLALMAMAGAASAQSTVTLFGIVDTGVSLYSSTSNYYNRLLPGAPAPAGTPNSVTASQAVLSSGNYVPSRIGVRGQEDLGGGLAAAFWLEAPMAVDSGATPLAFVRRTTVSLVSVYGELRLGRDITPIFWTDTIYDPFLNSGSGANLIGTVNARLALISAAPAGDPIGPAYGGPQNYPYASNSVGYFTPPGLGGFYGQLMYSIPEGIKSTLVPNSPSQRGALYGARAGFNRGNFDISGTYEVNTPIDSVAPFTIPLLDTKITTYNLGASYDFGVARLSGEISRAVNDSNAAIPFPRAPLGVAIASTSASYDGVMAGIVVPFGASAVRASYGRVNYDNDQATAFASNQNASASKVSLGYTYNFSKRTVLYATAAYVRMDDAQNNPLIMGTPAMVTGTPFLSTGTTSGYAPRSATGYDFGINHSF